MQQLLITTMQSKVMGFDILNDAYDDDEDFQRIWARCQYRQCEQCHKSNINNFF